MQKFKFSVLIFIAVAASFVFPIALRADDYVIQTVAEAKWGPAPPLVPPGAQIAVLSGDPTADSYFAIRIKFPANYKIPAHSHPTDEHVTVITGKLFIGMGDKLDAKAGKPLAVGGYALMPANMNHYAYTTGPTTIVLQGQGPLEFKYVNPDDDPRNKQ